MDRSLPSITAAREFAAQSALWDLDDAALTAGFWLEPEDLEWQPSATGWNFIKTELEQLRVLLEDDRDRYLAEAEAQADGLADYILAFIGATRERHPWTVELVSCGLAIGNVAYMRWKARFKRVRPSTLLPGLVPPFGPPGHPAFPSGHSTLGHFVALLLLEIPELAQRHGVFADGRNGQPADQVVREIGAPTRNPLAGTGPIESPLLWLAARLAKNRERIGVHYPSDSSAGRHLAGRLWLALMTQDTAVRIDSPSLQMVLRRARAEWAR